MGGLTHPVASVVAALEVEGPELPKPLPHRWRTKQNLDYCFLMMYAQSKGIYYVQVSTETLLCAPLPPPALDPGWAQVVSPTLSLCPS